MVETIIVAVFIIGICTFLFANFLPLIADYERVSNYDTLEDKYKTNEIRKMLLREIDNSNVNISSSVFESIRTNGKGYGMYNTTTRKENDKDVIYNQLCDQFSSKKYCNKLLGENYLNVSKIIIVPFKLGTLKNITKGNSDFTRSEKEYINYLPSYSKYSNRYDSYYRIIVVYKDGGLSNIEVHYEIG